MHPTLRLLNLLSGGDAAKGDCMALYLGLGLGTSREISGFWLFSSAFSNRDRAPGEISSSWPSLGAVT